MFSKKILTGLLVTIVAAGILAGCGSSASKNQPAAKSGALYSQIKSSKEIKIGTEGVYAPYSFHDESGKLVGYDVEVAEQVAKKLGVKPVFVETKWDAMIAGLDAGRFDVIANQVAVTEERKQKYEFSNPYIFIHGVLLTSKANNQIKTFTDLKGKKAAQTLTSNWGKTSEKYGATLVGVDGFEQSAELIQAGRADATINAEVAFLDYMKKKPNADLKVVATTKEAIVCALPIKKGNAELVKDINKALAELQADGTLTKLSLKYFGKDVSKN